MLDPDQVLEQNGPVVLCNFYFILIELTFPSMIKERKKEQRLFARAFYFTLHIHAGLK